MWEWIQDSCKVVWVTFLVTSTILFTLALYTLIAGLALGSVLLPALANF